MPHLGRKFLLTLQCNMGQYGTENEWAAQSSATHFYFYSFKFN